MNVAKELNSDGKCRAKFRVKERFKLLPFAKGTSYVRGFVTFFPSPPPSPPLSFFYSNYQSRLWRIVYRYDVRRHFERIRTYVLIFFAFAIELLRGLCSERD